MIDVIYKDIKDLSAELKYGTVSGMNVEPIHVGKHIRKIKNKIRKKLKSIELLNILYYLLRVFLEER